MGAARDAGHGERASCWWAASDVTSLTRGGQCSHLCHVLCDAQIASYLCLFRIGDASRHLSCASQSLRAHSCPSSSRARPPSPTTPEHYGAALCVCLSVCRRGCVCAMLQCNTISHTYALMYALRRELELSLQVWARCPWAQ